MKILRSMNRREGSVGTAGYFTVLRPARWFAASRLDRNTRHVPLVQGKDEDPQMAEGLAEMPEIGLRGVDSGPQDRNWVRLGFAVLAAIVITSVMLWWMIGARP